MSKEEFYSYSFSIKTVFTIIGSQDVISVLNVNFRNNTINGIPIIAIKLIYQSY